MATALASNPILARLHANKGMVFPLAFISLLLVVSVGHGPARLRTAGYRQKHPNGRVVIPRR